MNVQILGLTDVLAALHQKMKSGRCQVVAEFHMTRRTHLAIKLANWQPALWSPDNEINIYRDRIVSRMRDLVRNDGWASGDNNPRSG
jgi:capsid protein